MNIIRTASAAILVLSLVTVQLAHVQGQTGFWTLGVNVNNIPSAVNTVIVTVKTPFTVVTSRAIDSSSSGDVSTQFDIPTDQIPDGSDYRVCVHESGGMIDSCQGFTHTGGSSVAVTVTWP